MVLTIIYILFVIVYAILIYLGFSLLEDSNVLKNKGKKVKVNKHKKWFSYGIFTFLYAILIINSFFTYYLIVISLLLYATLLFFIFYSIRRQFKK